MAEYQLTQTDSILHTVATQTIDLETGEVTTTPSIITIPAVPGNPDYEAFLVWDAIPGNDPDPADPPVIRYAQQTTINAQVRTTDATVLEVFRFSCEVRHLYRADLRISGVDTAPAMMSLIQEGRFVWKRPGPSAVLSGITVVSQIPTTIPTGWATNCFPDGTDIVFTVKGPDAKTIDWLLVGEVGVFAPEGLLE